MPFETVEAFVTAHEGTAVINKVLIANNGIAAVKEMRSVRKFAYETFGNDRAIAFVVMATPEDLKANAEYIRMADHFMPVAGGSNNNNYANVDVIVDIAERAGVQAVWAGWGHASENPVLARRLKQAGIVFIGPPAKAMHDLGDKIASTLVAQSAGVPCVPWSGTGITVDYDKDGIPEEAFANSCVQTLDEARASIKKHNIQYPVMLKASEGGGGKGIRKVNNDGQLEAALRQVQSEMPGSPIFIMQLVANARHLEVQLMADQYGNAIALHGRDCSIQRRHQKIIEEGPPLAPSKEVWKQMERGAVALARCVGYVNAGTVEYLFVDGKFYFLELNPRLQVEHPVTEEIMKVNVPMCQLLVAMGIPLNRIEMIRSLYGHKAGGDDKIDFEKEEMRAPEGHVIACRITGENPDEGFKPTSGNISELTFRSTPCTWGYFSVGGTGNLHEFADSQFGHVFAYGSSREEARLRMVLALKEISIRGDIRTPVEYLIQLLEKPAFREYKIDTGWLDRQIAQSGSLIKRESGSSNLVPVICGALMRAHHRAERRWSMFARDIGHGRVSLRSGALTTTDFVHLIYNNIKFELTVRQTGPYSFLVTTPDAPTEIVEAELRALCDGGALILLDGAKHTCYSQENATGLRLEMDGHTITFENENDPSQLRSKTPGKLVRFLVENGTHISAGDSYAEMEVMKMFLPLIAHESGIINFIKPEGASLAAGAIVASLELDDASQVRRAEPFTGSLPQLAPPHAVGTKPSQVLRQCLATLRNTLSGYNSINAPADFDRLSDALNDPLLPTNEFFEALATLTGRIPKPLGDAIHKELKDYESAVQKTSCEFADCNAAIRQLLNESFASIKDAKAADVARATAQPLTALCTLYSDGRRGRLRKVITELLSRYTEVEKRFEDRAADDVLCAARDQYKDDTNRVFEIALSHSRPRAKTQLIAYIVQYISDEDIVDQFVEQLHELASLQQKGCMEAILSARQLLMKFQLPSFKQRQVAIENFIRDAIGDQKKDDRIRKFNVLADQSRSIFDVLVSFFRHVNPAIRCAAMEVYIRRAYRAYQVTDLSVEPDGSCAKADWTFSPLRAKPALKISSDAITDESSEDSSNGNKKAASKMWRADSVDNLLLMEQDKQDNENDSAARRSARMLCCSSLSEVTAKFDMFLADFTPPRIRFGEEYLNVLNICVLGDSIGSPPDDADGMAAWEKKASALHETFQEFVTNEDRKKRLLEKGVRRVTLIVSLVNGSMPFYYTYRQRTDFKEDSTHRHFEPTLAHMYELDRMSNYNIDLIATENAQVHLYHAIEKNAPKERKAEHCFFARAVLREGDIFAGSDQSMVERRIIDFLQTEVEKLFMDMMTAIDVASQNPLYAGARNHHLFINIVPEFKYEPELIDRLIRKLGERYGDDLWRLFVGQLELCVRLRGLSAEAMPLRFVVTNPTGLDFKVSGYYQVKDLRTGDVSFQLCYGTEGPLNGKPGTQPYPILSDVGRKRFRARAANTTYAYDFPSLFASAARRQWEKRAALAEAHSQPRIKIPSGDQLLRSYELVLNDQNELIETTREECCNDVGMVAWRLWIATPECPKGRELILLANDITHVIGSFGPREDLVFARASELAIRLGLPRLYVSANSGARIGLAKEVRDAFDVEWVDPAEPSKGFKYLYVNHASRQDLGSAIRSTPIITDEDLPEALVDTTSSEDKTADDSSAASKLASRVAAAAKTVVGGVLTAARRGSRPQPLASQYRLTDVIGREHGLGVENLQGSGMIAGITSRAYEEVFTASLVTGRTVGIGAYLVRLGQRTIQNQGPVLLTGAGALNKVLGRDVYTSNQQIGGTQIMYANGISHLIVHDELRGVQSLLSWLSFVPQKRDMAPPTLNVYDPLERDIDFIPDGQPYDPRHLIGGTSDADGKWLSGFFDKDSFVETLGGWAKTVVTGRARLGGIPIGVIIAETRTVEHVTPADPAAPDSIEVVTQQAGQVWFPDSAYKTATAIRDFNFGEQLPLMIIANWRGFSGGMRDMFEEILKYGAYIVDELRQYKQPIFVYIPPRGELRGGAWVVLDSTINPDQMEMYCDEQARGGVLEPQGLVSIKYRNRDLLSTMRRLDSRLIRLRARMDHVKEQIGAETPTPFKMTDADQQDDQDFEASGDVKLVTSDGELPAQLAQLQERVKEREQSLLPIYHQVAVAFAELHDTPGRMHAKGVVAGVLKWEGARRFFGRRLRRRMAEAEAIKKFRAASPDMSFADARTLLRRLYGASMAAGGEAAPIATTQPCGDDNIDIGSDASSPTARSPFASPKLSRNNSANNLSPGAAPAPGDAGFFPDSPSMVSRRSFSDDGWQDDNHVHEWLIDDDRNGVKVQAKRLRSEHLVCELKHLSEHSVEALVDGIAEFLNSESISAGVRKDVAAKLQERLKK